MNKKVAICVIIAAIAVIYAKTCKAETPHVDIKLTTLQVAELSISLTEIENIDHEGWESKGQSFESRADDMLDRIAARIARIEKFQKEHGH